VQKNNTPKTNSNAPRSCILKFRNICLYRILVRNKIQPWDQVNQTSEYALDINRSTVLSPGNKPKPSVRRGDKPKMTVYFTWVTNEMQF